MSVRSLGSSRSALVAHPFPLVVEALGVIAAATGLVQMSQDAAARTALAQAAAASVAPPLEPDPLFNPRLMAFGG